MKANTLFILGMSLTLSLQSVATPLAAYRAQIKATENTESALEYSKQLKNILNVNITSYDILKDKNVLQKLSSESRATFSNTFKQFLKNTTNALLADEKFQKPLTVDPRWSVEESRAMKTQRKVDLCRTGLKADDVNRIIGDLRKHAEASAKNNYSTIGSGVQKNQDAVLAHANASLIGLAANANGEKITASLGTVLNLGITNNVIESLQLSKETTTLSTLSDANTVTLTLPILIKFYIGQDDQFIIALKCLENFIKEQQDILEIRQAELKNLPAAQAIQETQSTLDKMYQEYKNDTSFHVKLTRQAFDRTYLPALAEKYPGAIYLLKKADYLNTKVTDEQAWNEKRIDDLKTVRPYIEMKVKGAQFANSQLKKLSETQIKQLITLLLDLRGSEIPMAAELQSLRLSGKMSDADLIQNQELMDSLADLGMFLTSPKM